MKGECAHTDRRISRNAASSQHTLVIATRVWPARQGPGLVLHHPSALQHLRHPWRPRLRSVASSGVRPLPRRRSHLVGHGTGICAAHKRPSASIVGKRGIARVTSPTTCHVRGLSWSPYPEDFSGAHEARPMGRIARGLTPQRAWVCLVVRMAGMSDCCGAARFEGSTWISDAVWLAKATSDRKCDV